MERSVKHIIYIAFALKKILFSILDHKKETDMFHHQGLQLSSFVQRHQFQMNVFQSDTNVVILFVLCICVEFLCCWNLITFS